MKNDNKYFFKELGRHYSPKFVFAFLLLILILLIPVFFEERKVVFDPIAFSNLYLSTAFTAILIAVVLQIMELYRSSLLKYKNVFSLLTSMQFVLDELAKELVAGQNNLIGYSSSLFYYKSELLKSFLSDENINQRLLQLYNRPEFDYLIESLKIASLAEKKRTEIGHRINELTNIIVPLRNEL